LPERVEAALADQSQTSQAAGAAMIPAADPSEFHFTWENAQSLEVEQLQAMNSVAAEAAFAIGANPQYAKSTVAYIDRQLTANTSGAEITPEQLDTALAAKFGNDANAIATSAVKFARVSRDVTKSKKLSFKIILT
jgi:hypothetical protein